MKTAVPVTRVTRPVTRQTHAVTCVTRLRGGLSHVRAREGIGQLVDCAYLSRARTPRNSVTQVTAWVCRVTGAVTRVTARVRASLARVLHLPLPLRKRGWGLKKGVPPC